MKVVCEKTIVVIPAKVGIQRERQRVLKSLLRPQVRSDSVRTARWIPAFAGMTMKAVSIPLTIPNRS